VQEAEPFLRSIESVKSSATSSSTSTGSCFDSSLPRSNDGLGLKYKYPLVSSSSPLCFSITCTVVCGHVDSSCGNSFVRIRSLAIGSCMVMCCDVFR
jgi:hypothetical protein